MSIKEPLHLDCLKKGLQDLHQKKYGRNLSPHVQSSLEQFTDALGSREKQRSQETHYAIELLSFAKSKKDEKLLRVVSTEVPKAVLPPGCSAIIHDIKVSGRGPDDAIYKKNEKIRKMIPRGVTILEWNNSRNNEKWSSVVIYGNKKFTGGIGDEDECQPENNDVWRSYFIKDPSMATKVVCMEKVNGEAAHIAGRYIDGHFYLIAGSKNVHMVIREKMDIDLYVEDKYDYAKVIARTVWDLLTSLGQQRQHLVNSLLHQTRCTLVGEILQPQNQHIVNLSYLKQPQVHIISMTPTYTDCQVDTLLVIPPHHLLDLCAALGLNTAAYAVVDEAEVMARKNKMRRSRDTEGEVLYYLDEVENTIGLIKVKTTWYIILRALREKAVYAFTAAKKKDKWTLEEHIKNTHRRFSEIQKWLKFSNGYLDKWKNLAEQFLRWLHVQISEGTEKPRAIRPTFPMVWSKFLRTMEQTDHIELEYMQ